MNLSTAKTDYTHLNSILTNKCLDDHKFMNKMINKHIEFFYTLKIIYQVDKSIVVTTTLQHITLLLV